MRITKFPKKVRKKIPDIEQIDFVAGKKDDNIRDDNL